MQNIKRKTGLTTFRIPVPAGLQWWMLLQAQGFATYALAVELRRLALAVAFMTRFATQAR